MDREKLAIKLKKLEDFETKNLIFVQVNTGNELQSWDSSYQTKVSLNG